MRVFCTAITSGIGILYENLWLSQLDVFIENITVCCDGLTLDWRCGHDWLSSIHEPMTESKLFVWAVRGWDTKQDRYQLLCYVKETKAEAYATCAKLHPTIDIESVYLVCDY